MSLPLQYVKWHIHLYLMCVKRNGIVSFIARLGRTSASKIAPVETGLQSLVLFVVWLGVGTVLYNLILNLCIILLERWNCKNLGIHFLGSLHWEYHEQHSTLWHKHNYYIDPRASKQSDYGVFLSEWLLPLHLNNIVYHFRMFSNKTQTNSN